MRTLRVFVSCLAIGATALTATAQQNEPGGGGGGGGGRARQPRGGGFGMEQLPPEKARAAWEAEAHLVAKNLGLTKEQTSGLVKAYTDARESQAKAMRDMMERARKERDEGDEGEGGRGRMRGNMEEMRQARQEAIEKFHKALTSEVKLTEEQSAKAMDPLGTFSPQWDRAVDTILGFKLDQNKQAAALEATETYLIQMNKAREARGDREEMQKTMQQAREKLSESLKKNLSEEQYQKVESAFGPGMRGPRGPRGGGENEGQGGGGRRRPGGGGG
jgi:hypothetical protein